VIGAHVDLVGELAGEADAHDARRHARYGRLLKDMKGKAAGEKSAPAHTGLQHRAALRPDHCSGREMLRDRGEVNAQAAATRSAASARASQHARRAAGGRGHQEVVLAERVVTPSSITMPFSSSIRP
jgi:hypothetical protein